MYRFNLNNVSNEKIEIVENYLNNEKISYAFFEHFAEISFNDDIYTNSNNESFMEIPELSIIHHEILCKNKNLVMKLCSLEEDKHIIDVLLISIEEEKTKRFKRKLENILNKSDKRLNKDTDLIDKKTKI